MTTNTSNIIVNEKTNRFELPIGEAIAYIDYGWRKEELVLFYIYVPIPHRGKGYSSALIEYAMQYARDKKVKVIVHCSYINRYLRMHPEHHDLVKSDE